MESRIFGLETDPIELLLSCDTPSIEYFTRRDLLKEQVLGVEELWELKPVSKILKRQQEDGSWKYPGKIREEIRSSHDYNQLETFRILGELVEKYGLNRKHRQIQKAANFLFSCQTPEGDFRGIYGNQYAPTYSPAIMELLIKAGYVNNPQIEKGFSWLLSQRQDDGGWAIPLRTRKITYKEALTLPETIETDPSKPFSNLTTGMVIRAFAAHPKYRKSIEAKIAGELLTSRFFKADKYPDRKDKKYWESVSYPFWFTNIVSALDSLSFLGFTQDNHQIKEGLNFLRDKQDKEGLFDLKLLMIKDKDLKYWICLAICRVFQRFYQ
ncbi:MAG: prenyltransferase/squalene oxidase repeat-containing protein [Methanobacteriaceae archaeon]|nr:prenyltransferase/squalene oxidase repeat-containing protein [Methanobacteriaceae archaeon]